MNGDENENGDGDMETNACIYWQRCDAVALTGRMQTGGVDTHRPGLKRAEETPAPLCYTPTPLSALRTLWM